MFPSSQFRMNEFTGAVGMAQLRKLDGIASALRKNTNRVYEAIKDLRPVSVRSARPQVNAQRRGRCDCRDMQSLPGGRGLNRNRRRFRTRDVTLRSPAQSRTEDRRRQCPGQWNQADLLGACGTGIDFVPSPFHYLP
jgi:hypothetical protein